jgi:uncharacterized protein
MALKPWIPLLIGTLFTYTAVQAQSAPERINSGALIAQSNELQEKGDYKAAINLLRKISRSDTGYADALYELSYCAIVDSQYNAGYQYAMEGMKLFPDKRHKYVLIAANALDDMKKGDEAVAMYTAEMTNFPHSHLLYFNRGITNLRQEKLTAATADFETAILIDPFYASSHYYRGRLYKQEGKLVPAMMAYLTYLMMAPEGRHRSNIIEDLAAIGKVSDDIRELAAKNSGAQDAFGPIQEILLSKMALDKQYKLKADLEDNIVRQIQVMNEQLQYTANDKSFAMQVYVPLFERIFKNDQFEAMIFTVFSGLKLDKVESWNKKNKKAAGVFYDSATSYLRQLRSTRELDYTQRGKGNLHYLFESGDFVGKGQLSHPAKSQYTGSWEFFYDNGIRKSKGHFNEAEEREGEWQFFYETGELKEKSNYRNGKAFGPSEGWFSNGNLWYKGNYINDELDGTYTAYFYNGRLRIVSQYKNGQKNGPEQQYSYKGFLNYTTQYTNGVEDGKVVSYHPNGQRDVEMMVKMDKKEGAYKSWYDNGKLEGEGQYENDQRQGLWTTYYKNGSIKEKTTYKDNEVTGEFTEYFDNGTLSRKGYYTRKKPDGKILEYDEDGKLYSEAVYERGKLRAINYFDKQGQPIATNTIQKNASAVTFYSPQGYKITEGYFNSQGDREGQYKGYYASGKVSYETQYKNGEVEGPYVTYYYNGGKKEQTAYTNGEEEGYGQSFYFNGQLRSGSWVSKRQRQQNQLRYNQLGKLMSDEYYLDDEQDGWSSYYRPNGTLQYEHKYYKDWLESVTQYDTTGKVLATNVFKGGKGPYLVKHFNGKPMAQGQYEHYQLHGPYNTFYFDGKPHGSYFYKRGELDSVCKLYRHNGTLFYEGRYSNGKYEGDWKYYTETGKPSSIERYSDGERNGETVIYSPGGTPERVIPFKDDMVDGHYKLLAPDGQLIVSVLFKKDVPLSYTYEGKDGQLVPAIPIKNGNGTVTAYYKNGNPSASFGYTDNELEGSYILYHPNGQTLLTVNKSYGYDDGKKTRYYADGKLHKEEYFILGNNHGSLKQYYPNGQLQREDWYYNDEPHGTLRAYNEQGKLTQTKTYYYGTLQSVQ